MKNFLQYLLSLLLFWFLVFFVQRNVFVFSNFGNLESVHIGEILAGNCHALALDISTCCYILLFPLLLFIAWFIKPARWVKIVLAIYFVAVIIASTLLTTIDNGLFRAWGCKLTPKALAYLDQPKEAMASTLSSPLFLLLLLFFFQTALFIWLYFRFVHKRLKKEDKKSVIFCLTFPIVFMGLLAIGARGGLQKYPINQSWSYYSKESVLNLSAVNSFWNFLGTLLESKEKVKNSYNYYDEKERDELVNELYNHDTTTISILTNPRPNIVLILTESLSAEAVGVLNPVEGQPSATPYLDKLSKEGLSLTRFYATGFRTEQGFMALLTGFPAQPRAGISREPDKFTKLPSLVRDLKNHGYHTAYITGGDVSFAKANYFLRTSGCDLILGDLDFPIVKQRATWGVYDEELFAFSRQNLDKLPQPFFGILCTTTNHEPFEAKVEQKFKDRDELKGKYLNTVYYSDKCIGDFIEKAKNEPWFKNTLFIIMADHAHYMPCNRSSSAMERHWIPCIMYGKVLKQEYSNGYQIDKIVSHSDFPKTILSQLGIPSEKYFWGTNIFNPNQKGFAFYTFDEGLGLIKENQAVVYDHRLNDAIYVKDSATFHTDKTILMQGKALLQKEMDDYVSF